MTEKQNCNNDSLVPKLRARDMTSHKGTFGRALIIAGSRGMTGAAALAGIATVNAGAGLVTVAVPDRCLETVAGQCLCYMTIPMLDDADGRIDAAASDQLMELSQRMTSVGIGPGLACSDGVSAIVERVFREVSCPMVVDADALNALAGLPVGLPVAAGPRILTPHVGEFRRLMNVADMSADECRTGAKSYAKKHRVVVVLKGPRTLVTDGDRHYENTTGNPGMATGGAGDVLTGVITALLGQGYTPYEAAVLGVYVHGLAGDIAKEERCGEIALNAEWIARYLCNAFRHLEKQGEP